MGDVRFIADAMLGRLARWLRLLGCDTYYDRRLSDSEVRRVALRDGRMILTRDRGFAAGRNRGDVCLVSSDDPKEQLREVLAAFQPVPRNPGRCCRCNGALILSAEREPVRSSLPDHVFREMSRLYRCEACERVYWEGSHMRHFRDMLGAIDGSLLQ